MFYKEPSTVSAHERNRVVNWKLIRPAWPISVIDWFDLSCPDLIAVCSTRQENLFSWNDSLFWKSQSTAGITVLHNPQKSLKRRLFQKKWAMNFIKPLATPRKHSPASFKVTINNHTISPEDNLKYLCPSWQYVKLETSCTKSKNSTI